MNKIYIIVCVLGLWHASVLCRVFPNSLEARTFKDSILNTIASNPNINVAVQQNLNARAQAIDNLHLQIKTFLSDFKLMQEEVISTNNTVVKLAPFRSTQTIFHIHAAENSIIKRNASFDMTGADTEGISLENATALITWENNITSGGGFLFHSPSLGLSFFNESGNEIKLKNLRSKIRINIPLWNMSQSKFESIKSRLRCMYFDTLENTYKTGGVDTVEILQSHAVCDTNHLTVFSILELDQNANDCPFFTECDPKNTGGSVSSHAATTPLYLLSCALLVYTTTLLNYY